VFKLTPKEEQQRLGRLIWAGIQYSEVLKKERVKIEENPYHFLAQRFPADRTWMTCVIGYAMLGKFSNFREAHESVRMVWRNYENTTDMCKHFAALLGVSNLLVTEVNEAQLGGKQRIKNILPELMSGTFMFP
jgi:hypothetical protein